mgnify:CR=1 FL=1
MKNLVKKLFAGTKLFKPINKSDKRIAQSYPILSTRPTFDNDEAESNFNGRLLTWEITGKQTYHLQENIKIIVDFLNNKWKVSRENEIIDSSVHRGNFSLWTKSVKFTFDLKKGKYDKDFFLESVEEMIRVSSSQIIGNLPCADS